jgi:hypothetical protein
MASLPVSRTAVFGFVDLSADPPGALDAACNNWLGLLWGLLVLVLVIGNRLERPGFLQSADLVLRAARCMYRPRLRRTCNVAVEPRLNEVLHIAV